MTRVCRVMALAIVCGAVPLYAEFYNCYTVVTPQADKSLITVVGRCSWYVSGRMETTVNLNGVMSVTPSNDKTYCSGNGYCGMSLQPAYIASTTYTSTATFNASQFGIPLDEKTTTDTKTTSDPINPHSACVDFSCNPGSPIVVSLRGAYHLTSIRDGVMFDIDADGKEERVSWTAAGSELGFLALDRNRNGRIDNGAELFGDAIAENGWVALAGLDGNGDEVIDGSDAAWGALLLWYDVDHDGRSDAGELVKVADTEIRAVATRYRWSGRKDPFGNTFRYAADVTLSHGHREAYDVYFLAAYE